MGEGVKDGAVIAKEVVEVEGGIRMVRTAGFAEFKKRISSMKTSKEKLHQLLDEYTQTPVNVRLAK